MKRLMRHVKRESLGYLSILFALMMVVGFVLIAKTIEAGNQRQERLCNHFIHLITVLPDGRVQFPGKPGQWTNIDLYVEKEVPGVMQLVEIRDFAGNGHRWQKLMIVERRCGE